MQTTFANRVHCPTLSMIRQNWIKSKFFNLSTKKINKISHFMDNGITSLEKILLTYILYVYKYIQCYSYDKCSNLGSVQSEHLTFNLILLGQIKPYLFKWTMRVCILICMKKNLPKNGFILLKRDNVILKSSALTWAWINL